MYLPVIRIEGKNFPIEMQFNAPKYFKTPWNYTRLEKLSFEFCASFPKFSFHMYSEIFARFKKLWVFFARVSCNF